MQTDPHTSPDFSLWKRFSRERQARKEAYRKAQMEAVGDALTLLSQRYAWDEIFIFGSVIRSGRFSKRSDVDIGIRGLNKFLHYQFVADISSLLDRDVDVIRLEDCDFSDVITRRGIPWNPKNLSFS